MKRCGVRGTRREKVPEPFSIIHTPLAASILTKTTVILSRYPKIDVQLLLRRLKLELSAQLTPEVTAPGLPTVFMRIRQVGLRK